MNLPTNIEICEVCPRDGFQSEKEWIPTDDKVHIIRELAKTGIGSIEVTSFVLAFLWIAGPVVLKKLGKKVLVVEEE